ncbi:hypothetical protein VPH35_032913 [Triticum aestivum]
MSKCTTVKFMAKFLVVASGENSAENIPMFPGLENFPGDVIHSSSYKSGKSYSGKNVLVIGSGNSGMEIAYDLATHGANTSIVIRSPVHSCNDKGINSFGDDTCSPSSIESS